MIALLRAIHAEQLKLRNTLALWLCVLAPLLVAVLGVAMIGSNPAMLSQTSMGTPWAVAIKTVMGVWAGMMLPLFVTLESALLAGLEHGNHQWKHLLALALPRAAHYAAKLIALIALVALSTTVLCLLTLAGGLLLALPADSALAGRPALGTLAGCATATMLAALPMIAAQFIIAIRWRSFSLAMASGITATMIAMFIPHEGIFGRWFPWAMPALAVNGSSQEVRHVVLVGIIAFCLLVALGVRDFVRRELA
jgi:hypothetical protein